MYEDNVMTEMWQAAPKTAGEVVEGLVTKCVAAPKTRTKELATELCLKYGEIEEKVIEALLAGFVNKNPKVSRMQFSLIIGNFSGLSTPR